MGDSWFCTLLNYHTKEILSSYSKCLIETLLEVWDRCNLKKAVETLTCWLVFPQHFLFDGNSEHIFYFLHKATLDSRLHFHSPYWLLEMSFMSVFRMLITVFLCMFCNLIFLKHPSGPESWSLEFFLIFANNFN